MGEFSIAGLEDVPALNALVNSAYRGETAKHGWTHEADLLTGIRIDKEELVSLINNKNTSIIKYTDNNKIVACMLLERSEDFFYLGMLTVDPVLQGQGFGKILLAQAEKIAATENITKIKMTVISTRYELIDWYKRRGFIDTGLKAPFPEDSAKFGKPLKPLEFIIMEKQLNR